MFGKPGRPGDEMVEFQAALEKLLTEPVASAVKRERMYFDELTGTPQQPLVLFGAGRLGRSILRLRSRLGVQFLAFADNNRSLWGTTIDGLTVYSPDDAVQRFGNETAFLVTIRHPGFTFEEAKHQLQQLGCERAVPIIALYWKYPELFLPFYFIDLPHNILKHSSEIRAAFAVLEENYSRAEFLSQLLFRLFLDQSEMHSPARHSQYFPIGLPVLTPNEVLVDCGAYDGDTLRAYITRNPTAFERIAAFEPDPTNYAMLDHFLQSLPHQVRARIDCRQQAVGAGNGKVRFVADGTVEAAVSPNGEMEVESVKLDDALIGWAPTHIKMDIEGAELDALAGAERIIRRHRPVLAICVYHRPDHLWRIPLWIHSLQSEYRLFLRPHEFEGWDLVCYAIPAERMASSDIS